MYVIFNQNTLQQLLVTNLVLQKMEFSDGPCAEKKGPSVVTISKIFMFELHIARAA